VGELQIRGTSLTARLLPAAESDRLLIADGWLHTGRSCVHDGAELVMCGRIKDVIIIGGRNIYPQDIEQVVGRIDDIPPAM